MPLSRLGITEITTAVDELGLKLDLLDASKLYAFMGSFSEGPLRRDSMPQDTDVERALAVELVAAGATVHYPAIIVYDAGRLLGEAIVGYKTAAAYEAMIAKRLAVDPAEKTTERRGATPPDFVALGEGSDSATASFRAETSAALNRRSAFRDIPVVGRPAPYFRFVRGRGAVAYGSGGVIYLLDLATGTTQAAPGFVDFVPSPDGRWFVTPADNRGGLEFYDAGEVFEEAARGAGRSVRPFYVDREMRDQYPSVGVLEDGREADASRMNYRVLTSWFDKVVFRDYELSLVGRGSPTVRPLTRAVIACREHQVSLPIIAQNGRELAARDEATATTKIFRLSDDGRCTEQTDTGLQTGKVAWAPDGGRIAFAIPEGLVRDGARQLWHGADSSGDLAGIFILHRERLLLTRVRGSEDVQRLAFPEFIGRDSVIFLISQADTSNRFRLVCCVR